MAAIAIFGKVTHTPPYRSLLQVKLLDWEYIHFKKIETDTFKETHSMTQDTFHVEHEVYAFSYKVTMKIFIETRYEISKLWKQR